MPESGRTISHYQILEKLGEGGMGVVYKARDLHLERYAAIKMLPPGSVADEDRHRRFVLEARAASALSQPNIVTIYDIDCDAGQHFIAMEYIAGKTLAAAIGPAGLPVGQALDYAIEIASALAAAHAAGIVHRDLKPANIMISDHGRVKVLDFGLAKLVETSPSGDESTRTGSHTASGAILGTAAYMSPEQALGQRVDVRTDIFSFGSLLYEALTGSPAFAGDSTATILAAILRDSPVPIETRRLGIPSDLARILCRCLEKDRDARYPSGAELHSDLVASRQRLMRHDTGFGALARRPRFAIPALLLLLSLLTVGAWFTVRSARMRWSRGVALPQAERLIGEEKSVEAFRLLQQAEHYVPDDPELKRLLNQCATPLEIVTNPAGADISWKNYRDIQAPWEYLGKSPVKGLLVPRAYLRWKIVREGNESRELAAFSTSRIDVALYGAPAAPGMVLIPGGTFPFQPTQNVKVDDYWLDRYEVTNRQYKEFVDQGGYRDRTYWKHDFVDGGRKIRWEEAMKLLRDSTGMPGPATWELGSYPEGRDDFPVGGVSWYEAAAYAEFAGKSLPTIYHWRRANTDRNFEIVSLSNFGGNPARVGSYPGLSPYGSFDMAGNVKEWCWNETDGLHYLLGAAWNELNYQFMEPDAQPPLSRMPNNGFRCARYTAPVPAPLLAEFRFRQRDYAKEKPASDEIFRVYRNLYAYDRTELESSTEAVDPSPRYWRREKVTFNAAYGRERVIALMFLPRNAKPPLQTVVYFPGASAFLPKQTSDSITGNDLDFIMRSGRALMIPIYKGTYERSYLQGGKPAATSNFWRDIIVACSKDLGRSLDYLESRPDIDRTKLAYYGNSAGALWGSDFLAVDSRFRAAVFIVGGLSFEPYVPEADPLHFAPRVHTPVLMLNGRYDFSFPLQICQVPLFRLLGVPDADKRHVLFDSAHTVPRGPMIKETLEWLDRYLGPIAPGTGPVGQVIPTGPAR
jgi:formylglycine-generating enzyme required for sulfatase activity/predicted Ser/Thr protein kinase